MGAAARAVGQVYDAFRPAGAAHPLAPENRFLRLPAAFNARDPKFGRASTYGRASWFGVFDSAYTRPGDYLVGPGGVFFIAAQEHLLPPLCVLTNARLRATRPFAAETAGLHEYGGAAFAGTTTTLLLDWPASVLASGAGGRAVLPTDGRSGSWAVLLPPCAPDLRFSDVLLDEQGRRFVAGSVERTGLGFRIAATLATP